MLFYDTEGEFGQENFKIVAQELFPLDIGTQTYTEYQTSDPELIKFMMSNPNILKMKKGHIHSHNNMGVFFSSTDDEELSDNCGFHNFYLSLIVNNKNEMCAKIAFKANIKSETTSTLTFKNQDGKDSTKVITSNKDSENILVYKCSVSTPQGGCVEDTFKSRFQELQTSKIKKQEDKKTSDTANKHKEWEKFGGSYNQGSLFSDSKGKSGVSSTKEEGYKFYNERDKSVDRDLKISNMRLHSLLGKLLSLDYLYEGTLASVLKKIDDKFYDIDGVYPEQAVSINIYYDTLEKSAIDFYMDSFPEDRNLLFFESTMEKCIEILENYENQFPELISNLTEVLNLEI